MSELDHGSKVPDTMTFTDEERALARQKQLEAEAAKKRRRNRILASVAGGATLIGGGIVAGLSLGSGGGSNAAPERSPAASATPTPGPETTAPTPETEPQADAFGINAADNPTFEDAVKAYYDKLDEYMQSSSDTYDQPGDPQYLTALFGVDWQNNPELSTYVGDLEQGSVTISTNHYATGENGGTEYENNTEVTEVRNVSENADQVAGEVTVHVTDNIMETVLAAGASSGVDADVTGNYHLTFTNRNGNWVVTEVDNLDNNS